MNEEEAHDSSAQNPPPSSDSTPKKLCPVCAEPSKDGARVCRACGADQTWWRPVSQVLKWMAGIATVVSLIIGMSSLHGLYQSQRETNQAVREFTTAADVLAAAGNYRRAWDLYQRALALAPSSPRVRRGQEALLRLWLPDARVTGEENWTDLVDRVLPVLALGVATSQGQRAADFTALMGWAYQLQFKDARLPNLTARIPALYQDSLAIDPDNVLALTFLAHWKASETDELAEADRLFRDALSRGEDRAFVRRFQWAGWNNARFRAGEEELSVLRGILLSMAWDITRDDEPLPQGSHSFAVEVLRSYGRRDQAEDFETALPLLSPPQHIAVIDRMLAALDNNDSFVALQGQMVRAMILERTGDVDAARDGYLELDPRVDRANPLREPLDAAIERTLGVVTDSARERADPLEYHGKNLVSPDVPAGDLEAALAFFDYFADEALAGENPAEWPGAIEVLQAAIKHVSPDEPDTGAWNTNWRLKNDLGTLLLASRRLDEAIAVFSSIAGELRLDRYTRSNASYNLACAHSLRGGQTSPPRRDDIDAAVNALRQAIELEFTDWEQIATDSDLAAIRDDPRYRQLMAGHQ